MTVKYTGYRIVNLRLCKTARPNAVNGFKIHSQDLKKFETLTHLPEWLFYYDFLHCSGSMLLQFYWSAWNRAHNKIELPKIIYTFKVHFTIFFVAKFFFRFFSASLLSLLSTLTWGYNWRFSTTWTESGKVNLQLDAKK